MAAGVPVVTTNVASLPEAAGGAALLVDPDDSEALIDSVRSAALVPEVRDLLIAKGRERVSELTWGQTARAVDAVLQSAIG
jgi:glycosyltransferase involved in cell wall biosynthesis